jgi:hypothetical protein
MWIDGDLPSPLLVPDQRGEPVVHRQAIDPLPQPQVRRTTFRVDCEYTLSNLCGGGCEHGAEAVQASTICESATCLQIRLRVSGQRFEMRPVVNSRPLLGEVENWMDPHFDRDEIARILQAISSEVLPVLGEGPGRRKRGVEAPVLPLPAPAACGLEDEPQVEGLSTFRNVAPDDPGKGQIKPPDSKAAKIPTICRISPSRILAIGVRPRRLGSLVVSQVCAASESSPNTEPSQ